MRGDGDSIKGLLKHLDEMGGHIVQLTPSDKDDKPIFTLLLIEHPDEREMEDLKALQQKWEDEAE